ncbi:MAG: transglutaminase-like domain-containing protein [Planctomycetota bacterium]|jgi:hypothetical protein
MKSKFHQPFRLGSALFTALVLLFLLLGLGACRSTPEEIREADRVVDPFVTNLGLDLDPGMEQRLSRALASAGENRDTIEGFLHTWKDPEKQRAAAFLAANMPVADLSSMNVKDLGENLGFAFRARNELPWGKEPPMNIFLHYVLPHRVTQEAFLPWRPYLFDELKPFVMDLDSMADAAMAVNRWCDSRTRFVQTEFRDQSAVGTLRCGYGRCEELMCLTICALRSVGVPARPCSTPWWIVNDNNHAWVEVWADGRWHYLGGCEGTDALNRTWFRGSAKRAGMVVSTMYGTPDGFDTGEDVCRVLNKSAYINSTAVYSATCRLDLSVEGPDGAPLADCPVTVSVFNFGGLRPLFTKRTDSEGKASILVGMGDFFVTAGKDDARNYRIASTTPGGTLAIALLLEKGKLPPEAFWLRYPTPVEADRMASGLSKEVREVPVRVKPELPPREEADLYSRGKDPYLDRRIDALADPEGFQEMLKDCGENWRALAAALKSVPGGLETDLQEFMKRTSHLDRIELTPYVILDHVENAAKHRSPGMDDSVYFDHVLNGRIYLEHLTAWRKFLAARYAICSSYTREETARLVNAKIALEIAPLEKERLAPMMNPAQATFAGRATGTEAAILAVAVLRSLGIAARKMPHSSKVAFLDGENWIPMDPLKPDAFGRSAEEDSEPAGDLEEAQAAILLELIQGGEPKTDFKGYSVARFENGGWIPLRNVSSKYVDEKVHLEVPPGEYLITAGVRNANGDPWVQTRHVALGPGDSVEKSFLLDLPEDAGLFKFPVVRKLETIPSLEMSDGLGARKPLDELVQEHPLLLLFYLNDHEPSARMLPKIADAHSALEEVGVRTMGICLPATSDDPRPETMDSGLPFPLRKGNFSVGQSFGLPLTEDGRAFEAMPSVLLLNRGGKPLLWVEGYELKIDVMLEAAARMVR